MTRRQRRLHLLAWLVLAPAALAILILSLAVRRSAPAQDDPLAATPLRGGR